MSDASKAIVQGLYDRVNAADFDVVEEVLSEDFIEHEEVPGLAPTRAGVRQMFEMFHASFKGATFEVDDVIADGDKVSVRGRLTGIHRAEFMGVPASGNAINVGLSDYFRVADGMVREHWGVMDTGALMQQLTGG
jgi:steroid delta-isomerase-like uncharacterized protein